MTDTESELVDDSAHSISSVNVYDAVLTMEGDGAYLGIVIAAPVDTNSWPARGRPHRSTPLIVIC
jgi:hypothetical protein